MSNELAYCAGRPAIGQAESQGEERHVSIDIHALFREHKSNLVRFVRRYVRTDEDAEDVVQNTFLEAIRCADRFAGLSKPSTWLFGIALNVARNHVRRNLSYMTEPINEAAMEELVDTSADPAEKTELNQIAEHVLAVLDDVPTKIRNTFEAVVEGGWTYEQAALMLRVPIGTVRSRVSRVRSTIRSRVDYKT